MATILKKTGTPRKVVGSAKKKLTKFKVQIFSRHPSHSHLREGIPLLPFKSVVKLGSDTIKGDERSEGGNRVEINTVASIGNSADKLKMKECFSARSVKSCTWWKGTANKPADVNFPIVAKARFGSRGNGNTLIKTQVELDTFKRGKDLTNYIFEAYYNYVREYRLHITKDGCFYTNRKMLKRNTPEANKWYRNDDNCTWILETNPQFDKPTNWNNIVAECVKALQSTGLDIGACDVRVQSATREDGARRRDQPEFAIIEINSAASHGEKTALKYREILPQLLRDKYVQR